MLSPSPLSLGDCSFSQILLLVPSSPFPFPNSHQVSSYALLGAKPESLGAFLELDSEFGEGQTPS